MYNTLKEIQEALPEKDILKYVSKVINKTTEEIVEILKLDNIDISIEAAKECVDYLGKTGSISDEELENVAGGGGCGSDPEPKYKENQQICRYYPTTHNYRYYTVVKVCEYDSDRKSYRYIIKCKDNNREGSEYLDSDPNYELV